MELIWFVLLVLLEVGNFAALWWLTRMAWSPDPALAALPDGPPPPARWASVATAQIAGNAASKVVPGGGVVQGSLLVRDGQPGPVVASALAEVGLLTTAVLLLLPVLTVPALLIGPPPDEQLQLGLLVSLILAVVPVGLGVAALTWPRSVSVAGRVAGRILMQRWCRHCVVWQCMTQVYARPSRTRYATSPSSPIRRVPLAPLLGRMWELRDDVTPYDAAYVALAERLDGRLVTCDSKLAHASGVRCAVDLIA